MRVVIEASAEAAADCVARRLAAAIRARPDCVLGIATGRTMMPVYAKLAALCKQEDLSLARVSSFNLDEYIGVAAGESVSFRSYTLRHLAAATDLPAASVHAPDGAAADVFAEAERYEQAIREAGGIDLQLLGLGRNGHIGFNEPGSSLASRTRVKALSEQTLRANRADLGSPAPNAAITVGLGTILSARSCLLLAVGTAKSAAVAAMVEGPVTARVPASVLQHHPSATVLLDPGAAADLQAREYYESAERIQRRLEESRR